MCVCVRERERGIRGKRREKWGKEGEKKEGNVIKEELWGNLQSMITLILPTRSCRRHRGTIRKFKLDLLLVECDTVKTSLSQKALKKKWIDAACLDV